MAASGSDSDNESDFASAESDTEAVGEKTKVEPENPTTPPVEDGVVKTSINPSESTTDNLEHKETQFTNLTETETPPSSGHLPGNLPDVTNSPDTVTQPPSDRLPGNLVTQSPSDRLPGNLTNSPDTVTQPPSDHLPGNLPDVTSSPDTVTQPPSDCLPGNLPDVTNSPDTPSPSDKQKSSTSVVTEVPVETASSIFKQTVSEPLSDSSTSVGKGVSDGDVGGGSGGGDGGGWGGWGSWGGSLWSSVSTVAESAQAIGQKVTSAIASVEDSLGVPSPHELAQDGDGGQTLDQETLRLAEKIKEHDVSPEDTVKVEPHQGDGPPDHGPPDAGPDVEATPPISESQQKEEHQDLNFGAVSGFFSGFAAAVQSTSQGLVSGGLDALETLGKKTMEVLSDGDPRLAKKRALLGVGPSPSLSQLLKEAKAEVAADVGGTEADTVQYPLNYSRLFDEYHGVGHLEALELLSKECAGKIHGMCGDITESQLQSLQGNLKTLSAAFSIDEEQDNLEDDSSQLEEVRELFSSITLPLKVEKLIKVSTSWREKVESISKSQSGQEREGEGDGKEGEPKTEEEGSVERTDPVSDKKATSEVLYGNGLRSLAELTSTAIELFRKMGEVSLLPDLPRSDPLLQAQKLNRLTVLVFNELDALASVHAEVITNLDLEGTNANVTSLYLESSNSGSYVQDAFQLLLPVLKVSLIQQLKTHEPLPNVLHRN